MKVKQTVTDSHMTTKHFPVTTATTNGNKATKYINHCVIKQTKKSDVK